MPVKPSGLASFKALAQRFEPETWLKATLETYLADRIRSTSGRLDPGWLHPSDMAEECMRRLLFKYLGVPEERAADTSTKLQRIFDNGKLVGLRYQAYIAEAGLTPANVEGYPEGFFGHEHRLEDAELHIRGSADNVIWCSLLGEAAGVEIKSMNHNEFSHLKSEKPDHTWQVQTYFLLAPLSHFWYLYEDKDNQDFITFYQQPDPSFMATIRAKALTIVQAAEQHVMLERTVPPSHCQRCPFQYCCDRAYFDAEGKWQIEAA